MVQQFQLMKGWPTIKNLHVGSRVLPERMQLLAASGSKFACCIHDKRFTENFNYKKRKGRKADER